MTKFPRTCSYLAGYDMAKAGGIAERPYPGDGYYFWLGYCDGWLA